MQCNEVQCYMQCNAVQCNVIIKYNAVQWNAFRYNACSAKFTLSLQLEGIFWQYFESSMFMLMQCNAMLNTLQYKGIMQYSAMQWTVIRYTT